MPTTIRSLGCSNRCHLILILLSIPRISIEGEEVQVNILGQEAGEVQI